MNRILIAGLICIFFIYHLNAQDVSEEELKTLSTEFFAENVIFNVKVERLVKHPIEDFYIVEARDCNNTIYMIKFFADGTIDYSFGLVQNPEPQLETINARGYLTVKIPGQLETINGMLIIRWPHLYPHSIAPGIGVWSSLYSRARADQADTRFHLRLVEGEWGNLYGSSTDWVQLMFDWNGYFVNAERWGTD